MRNLVIPALVLLSFGANASAQTMPADPVKHVDGYWYGEDRKVEISVKDGVATVEVNTSEDKYVRSLNMAPGTEIARLAGFTQDGKRLARLHGQCWSGGYKPGLINCGDFNAILDLSMENGKQYDRLKINTLQFRRKAQMPEHYWENRK